MTWQVACPTAAGPMLLRLNHLRSAEGVDQEDLCAGMGPGCPNPQQSSRVLGLFNGPRILAQLVRGVAISCARSGPRRRGSRRPVLAIATTTTAAAALWFPGRDLCSVAEACLQCAISGLARCLHLLLRPVSIDEPNNLVSRQTGFTSRAGRVALPLARCRPLATDMSRPSRSQTGRPA